MEHGNRPFLNNNGFWVGVGGIAAVVLLVVVFLQGGRESQQQKAPVGVDQPQQAPSKQLPQPR